MTSQQSLQLNHLRVRNLYPDQFQDFEDDQPFILMNWGLSITSIPLEEIVGK